MVRVVHLSWVREALLSSVRVVPLSSVRVVPLSLVRAALLSSDRVVPLSLVQVALLSSAQVVHRLSMVHEVHLLVVLPSMVQAVRILRVQVVLFPEVLEGQNVWGREAPSEFVQQLLLPLLRRSHRNVGILCPILLPDHHRLHKQTSLRHPLCLLRSSLVARLSCMREQFQQPCRSL